MTNRWIILAPQEYICLNNILISLSVYFDLSLNRIIDFSTSGLQICRMVFETFTDKLQAPYIMNPAVDWGTDSIDRLATGVRPGGSGDRIPDRIADIFISRQVRSP